MLEVPKSLVVPSQEAQALRWPLLKLIKLIIFRIRRIWSQSIEDVTMDNQQPSPVIKLIFNLIAGCRSQTKMAVGNLLYLII